MEYCIPLDKARTVAHDVDPVYFAPGSLSDPALLIWPTSPTTPFEFLFPRTQATPAPLMTDKFACPQLPLDGVQRVVGLPRIFGLHGNNSVYARVNHLAFAALAFDASAHPPMMDSGTNICVTGILGLLVNVISIPPRPISVAAKSHQASLDNCCTKQGYLPLTLDDGSIYYQVFYYCKNATETIILPDAILQSSNILTCWQQQGHWDGSPGSNHFTSNRRLYSFALTLEKSDGLYYCPTDVFTVAPDPTCPDIPRIHRVAIPTPPELPNVKGSRRYQPASRSKLSESQTWMLWLCLPGKDH